MLDPTALRTDDIAWPGPDANLLVGKTVGFQVDEMWRAWDWISEIWAEEFRKTEADMKFWRSGGRTGSEGDPLAKSLDAFLESIDVSVVGPDNCGSCTDSTIRDALSAAAKNLLTTAVCTDNFKELSRNLARRSGRSGLRIHVLSYPLNEKFKGDVDPVAHEHFAKVVKTMGAQLAAREAAE